MDAQLEILPVCLEAITRIAFDSGVKVMIFSRVDDPNSYEIGQLEGFRFIESPSIPEQPTPRQDSKAFIHRKAGHYGF